MPDHYETALQCWENEGGSVQPEAENVGWGALTMTSDEAGLKPNCNGHFPRPTTALDDESRR